MSMLDERGGGGRADHGAAVPTTGPDDVGSAGPADSPTDSAAVVGEGGVLLHRRRGALALVGTGAIAVAVAYTWRAADGGSALGYLLAVAMLPIAVVHLAAWWDAHVPLLLADRTGLRLREGRRWTGLRWEEARLLRLTPTRLPRRDGRLVVEGGDGVSRTLPLALVDPADLRELPDALRHLAAGRAEVVVDVRTPAPQRRPEPAPDAGTGAESDAATGADTDAASGAATGAATDAASGAGPETTTGTATETAPATTGQPSSAPTGSSTSPDGADKRSSRRRVASMFAPVRRGARYDRRAGTRAVPAAGAARADVVHSQVGGDTADAPTDRVAVGERTLRDAAPGRVGLVLELDGAAPAVTPVAEPPTGASRAGTAGSTRALRPATETRSGAAPSEPVIGPELSAARERVRLHVDDLAERTRIRPHVIEAIEVDDFSACGGDVYARGHLRALARAVGIEPDPLVAAYDEHYASAPVSARRVFEAELAGAGRALRPTSDGPRWSVLVIVVLVLVLVWGLARLLVPAPVDGNDRPDRPGQSVGGDAQQLGDGSDDAAATAAQRFAGMGQRQPTTRIRLVAAPDTATATPVVVRSADGSVVFRGTVGPDQPRTVRVVGAATVSTPDAGAVLARVDGRDQGLLGEPGEAVRTTVGG